MTIKEHGAEREEVMNKFEAWIESQKRKDAYFKSLSYKERKQYFKDHPARRTQLSGSPSGWACYGSSAQS